MDWVSQREESEDHQDSDTQAGYRITTSHPARSLKRQGLGERRVSGGQIFVPFCCEAEAGLEYHRTERLERSEAFQLRIGMSALV